MGLIEDGVLVEETDFVSGNVSRGYIHRSGSTALHTKSATQTLRGANYASKVSYWMPFNGNVGMHDASWRNSFGADIYLRNGSHGCVNSRLKRQKRSMNTLRRESQSLSTADRPLCQSRSFRGAGDGDWTLRRLAFTELTQEQQIQLLIEAGLSKLLNPDGTPVQQPQETLPQTPQETLPPASQEILPPAPQDIPVENTAKSSTRRTARTAAKYQ